MKTNKCNASPQRKKSNQMTDIEGEHAEFADDASVWTRDKAIKSACKKMNNDLVIKNKWCGHLPNLAPVKCI